MAVIYILEEVIENLKTEEGFSRSVYTDTLGYETIGYGRNISTTGPGITEAEAEHLLENDVETTILELDRSFDWFKDKPRDVQHVMIEMCFQLGLSQFLRFRQMISALSESNYSEAAKEIENSKYYRQVPARAKRYIKRLQHA
tara:strand:+ start:1593 stop:2021 length:429 start_codon:yes stop_codon:yes gene_type:complete